MEQSHGQSSPWLAYIPHIYSLVLIVLAMIAAHAHAETTR